MEAVVTAITSDLDWSGVITGIGVVAGGLGGVYIVGRGARMLLSMIRR